jgi:hypothetical protein
VLIEAKDGLVDVKVGEMRLTLTGSGGGRAELKAGGTTLVLKQDADLEIKSAARLKIQAAEIELSASGTLKLQGAQVQVN